MTDNRLKYADKISLERIELMHPKYRSLLREQYLDVNMFLPHGVRLRITQTLRTNKEQDDLYSQGRTRSGKIVTNAKGGQSIHNYGLAFDFVILLNEKNASWSVDKNWMTVVNYFKKQGWHWGGDFKTFKDNPHFEVSGMSWRDLQNKNKDKDGYPIL